MDARTGLVIGGMTAVAASVAVVCAVAMTNTAALKDSPATTVAASRILVPAASSPSATPTPTPEVPTPAVTPTQAEVVEAPDPTEVEPSVPSAAAPPQTSTVAAPPAPDAGKTPADVDAAIEAARATGTWDSLRAWAAAHGWTTGRIDALVERLMREAARDRLSSNADLQGPGAGESSKEAGTADRNGSVQTEVAPSKPQLNQQKAHPEHPANAGSNGNGNGAGSPAKKDQSRNSPDKRD